MRTDSSRHREAWMDAHSHAKFIVTLCSWERLSTGGEYHQGPVESQAAKDEAERTETWKPEVGAIEGINLNGTVQ